MQGTIDFKTCYLHLDNHYCNTVFPDGLSCAATTSLEVPEQVASARAMGYPVTHEGLAKMLCEHEISHHFVAQQLGEPYSFVISSLAHSKWAELSPEAQQKILHEESVTGAWQTYWNTGEIHKEVYELAQTDEELLELKKKFELLLGTLQKWKCG